MRMFLLPLIWLSASSMAVAVAERAAELPAEFLHDRVWLVPEVEGVPIRFFTDTGGGHNAISEEVAERLGLTLELVPGDGGRSMKLAPFPNFDESRTLPDAPPYFMNGRLAVLNNAMMRGKPGFLGGRWFADGIWEFDYPSGRLSKLAAPARPREGIKVPLGFQVNADGQRTMHFPSMSITVDDEVLMVLLDTGASATLTATSGPVFGLSAGTEVGTSFIEHEVFERWVQQHPDWRVLADADMKGDQLRRMIEVPRITVGGHEVGPVWFSEQPPGAFQRYMASMMDQPTWGALGGSALKYFRMTVDYPGAVAIFEPPGDAQ